MAGTIPSIQAAGQSPTPATRPYDLTDGLFTACVSLVRRPVTTGSADGLRTSQLCSDGASLRDAKVLAFLLRTAPAGEAWPFTAIRVAGLVGLRGHEFMESVRRLGEWGYLDLEKIGRQGHPGPTFQTRWRWDALMAEARKLGIDPGELAGAALALEPGNA